MIKKILILAFTAIMLSGSISVFAAEGSANYRLKRYVSQLYDKRQAMEAQRRIPRYGKEATFYLIPVLSEKNNEAARIAALRVLANIGDPAAEDAVVKLLKDKNHRIRQEAARALSMFAEKESTIKPLKRLLTDYFPNVRYNAVRALSKLAPKDETDLFIAALGDYDPRVRLFSVIALRKLKSTEAVPYLTQLVRDIDPAVRIEVVKALGSIGTQDCVQPLAWLTGDPDVNIRIMAIAEIININADGVEKVLIDVANSSDPRVASRAILGLAERKSPKALEVAREYIDDEHMAVKLAAIEVIGRSGDESDEETLKPMLEAESTLVRGKAAEALANINN